MGTLATNVTPEFRAVSGRRRMEIRRPKKRPEENEIKEITPQASRAYLRDPFSDAPLNAGRHGGRPPHDRAAAQGGGDPSRDRDGDNANSREVKTDKTHLTSLLSPA